MPACKTKDSVGRCSLSWNELDIVVVVVVVVVVDQIKTEAAVSPRSGPGQTVYSMLWCQCQGQLDK